MSNNIDSDRRHWLGAGALAVAGTVIPGVRGDLMATLLGTSTAEGELASLSSATAWLNSPALTSAALRGKVVLIDVGTYTCINWLRTLPYIRAWAGRYKAHGLVVISVHAPEFRFEHDLDNVRRAMKDMRVEHPIAVDNSFSIWRAFRNRFWPSRYLIDTRERISHQHFGEGEYERSERAIQDALTAAGAGGLGQIGSIKGAGIETDADWDNLKSSETYIGYERSENFASPGGLVADARRTYAAPERLRRNQWALSGDWTVKRDAAVLDRADGRIAFSFHARDLHLVLGPVSRGVPVRFRVLLDGRTPGAAHGGDVDEQGQGAITEPRLYQLIRQPAPIVDRQFTIEFLDAGAEAFAFTFG